MQIVSAQTVLFSFLCFFIFPQHSGGYVSLKKMFMKYWG